MRGALAGVGPALNQGHVHAGVFVREQLDVGHRPARLPHVEGDPVALEDLLVAPRVVSRSALVGSDGDGELLRRSRLDEQHGDPECRHDDQRRRRECHQQILAKDAARPRSLPLPEHDGAVYVARLPTKRFATTTVSNKPIVTATISSINVKPACLCNARG